MTKPLDLSQLLTDSLQQHFLNHQRLWAKGLLLAWMCIHVALASTNVLLEYERDGRQLNWWEPMLWETSSFGVILLLLPLLVRAWDWLHLKSRTLIVLGHCALIMLFSFTHVSGMVLIRKLGYAVIADWDYRFGSLWFEGLYEFRKDLVSYLILLLVVHTYRFVVLRMRGEASYLTEGEFSPSEGVQPQRLLIRKLGKEYLVKVDDIEWIEASGNYANLHIGEKIYPMRVTMKKLESLLPKQNFARIHRSTIVNLAYVQHLQALETGDYEVTLSSARKLNLSRRYREAFRLAHEYP